VGDPIAPCPPYIRREDSQGSHSLLPSLHSMPGQQRGKQAMEGGGWQDSHFGKEPLRLELGVSQGPGARAAAAGQRQDLDLTLGCVRRRRRPLE
jgi:hypothetical protein